MMLISRIEAEEELFHCEYGEFTFLPNELNAGPPPTLFAVRTWFGTGDSRISLRTVDGQTFADVSHDNHVWIYKVSRAYSWVPSETIFFQQLEPFGVAVRAD